MFNEKIKIRYKLINVLASFKTEKVLQDYYNN